MSLNVFSAFMPREESFTPLFVEQAGFILQAADELRQLMADDSAIGKHVAAIRRIELTADDVARRIFVAANRTFNAPIDREDILELARRMDDCVDLIEDTAKGILRYELREFSQDMRSIVNAAVEAASVLREVMPLLDSITREHAKIAALCERVGIIEGRADEAFDLGLTRLRAQLRDGAVDTIGYLDRKELYELIENVVDKCDDVSNAIQSITAKHV